ncbi:ceramide kinase-like isoform X1 [Octopus vulgaris]|uniref:Ceramide kinase-like isoform X1 n=2 Tax=Octopus TaxID=6643 RepID=A0AA36AJ32_OCTVU|nr:ceramide kinase [Octopus sinensis]UUA79788.1 ceramide kinase [Octopus vulgaris]CAI9715932.1 ceramide kinase-like isoform X1 [Octopus vulgaris]
MAADQNILLYGNLDVDGRPSVVLLTSFHLSWDSTSKAGTPESPNVEVISSQNRYTIELNEVIGVTTEKYDSSSNGFSSKDSSTLFVEMQTLKPHVFSVFHIRRIGHHKWRERKVTFRCRDSTTCQIWVESIRKGLTNPKFRRPKSLLVFINPVGGKKKGPKIYAEKVVPLFDLADIIVHSITTDRANYALDYLQEADLAKYDGIVCVGGDGMFTELLNGLLIRTLKDNGNAQPCRDTTPIQPDLRIGIIPAGSTDTVVYSTVGINDPVTSALHIITGDSMNIDCCSIYQRDQLVRYSVSLVGYGYYGDVLADSEKFRWMGTKRYNWSGFKKFLANQSYLGEVSFLPTTVHDSHPRDNTRCLAGCQVCAAALDRLHQYPSESSSLGKEKWHTIRGDFIGVNAVTMSCRCAMSPEGVSPACHLGDGCTDLILVKRCSRLNYLHHLYRCRDRQSDQFDFDFVQVHRVKEFQFRPLEDEFELEAGEVNCRQQLFRSNSKSSHNSVWNCDGEVIGSPSVHVQVHCQLVKLFARGIEKLDKEHSGCIPCQQKDK